MYQVFTTADLRRLGCSDRDVSTAADCCLERVARGRFAVKRLCDNPRHARIAEAVTLGEAELFEEVGDVRDALARAKVLIRTRADFVNGRSGESGRHDVEVFSHLSAALLWGFTIVKMDKPFVEVIRTSTNKRHAHLFIRRRDVPPGQIDRLGDVALTTRERTLIDVARDCDLDISVPMLDDALRRHVVTPDGLRDAAAKCRETRGRFRVAAALDLADPRRESPGESISAVRLHEVGLTGFEPQVEIADAHGRFVARVDFLHAASKTILEFDGRIKYTIDDTDPRHAFDRERERERQLRALGYTVVRIFWKDLWRRRPFTDLARLVSARTPAAPTR